MAWSPLRAEALLIDGERVQAAEKAAKETAKQVGAGQEGEAARHGHAQAQRVDVALVVGDEQHGPLEGNVAMAVEAQAVPQGQVSQEQPAQLSYQRPPSGSAIAGLLSP